MKKIIFIILLALTVNAQSLLEGTPGDVWHLTGSTIGTLAIQKTFNWEWRKSAAVMFSLGFAWEVCDETFRGGIFDPAGFSGKDLLFDGIGCLISYPLRYKNLKISGGYNEDYTFSLSVCVVY